MNRHEFPTDETGLLERVQAVLTGIDAPAKCTREDIQELLRVTKGTDSLRGLSVTMVDDETRNLKMYIPILEVATQGHAHAVKFTGQSLDTLCDEILATNPDAVLVDMGLADFEDPEKSLLGCFVAQKLLERHPSLFTIGFSSSPKSASEFPSDPRSGFVTKYTSMDNEFYNPTLTIKNLASVIANARAGKPLENRAPQDFLDD